MHQHFFKYHNYISNFNLSSFYVAYQSFTNMFCYWLSLHDATRPLKLNFFFLQSHFKLSILGVLLLAGRTKQIEDVTFLMVNDMLGYFIQKYLCSGNIWMSKLEDTSHSLEGYWKATSIKWTMIVHWLQNTDVYSSLYMTNVEHNIVCCGGCHIVFP